MNTAELKLAIPAILLEGDRQEASLLSGPGQKHVLAPKPTPSAHEPHRALPGTYGSGTLRLIARDPRWLFVHWDPTPEQQRSLGSSPRPTLRVRRGGLTGAVVQDIQLHPDSYDWLVQVADSNVSYAVELGFPGPEGGWTSVVCSEPVYTPPDSVSGAQPAQLACVPFDAPLPPSTDLERGPLSLSKAEPPRIAHPSLVISKPELPLPRESAGAMGTPGPESLRGRSVHVSEPPQPTAAPTIQVGTGEGCWTVAQEQALAELVGLAWVVQASPGSVDVIGLLRQHLDFRSQGAGVPQPNAPASGELISSWPSPVAPGGPSKFWLTVNAELVVYGATLPDAQVTMAGRRIRLRPDGSFSFRFALPDGEYALPVSAQSAAGDSRRADLRFSRQSHYQGQVDPHAQDPSLGAPTAANVS